MLTVKIIKERNIDDFTPNWFEENEEEEGEEKNIKNCVLCFLRRHRIRCCWLACIVVLLFFNNLRPLAIIHPRERCKNEDRLWTLIPPSFSHSLSLACSFATRWSLINCANNICVHDYFPSHHLTFFHPMIHFSWLPLFFCYLLIALQICVGAWNVIRKSRIDRFFFHHHSNL